jgi:lysophospholipase L1-like esterase
MQKVITQLFILILMINNLNYSAQDWPNLKKYQKENATLKPTEKNEKRVVFMGNSITEFWGSFSDFFSLNKGYINRGISGQTTPQMLLRFRQDVIELSPSTVVILAGINDIAQNTGPSSTEMIANNIFSMAELAKVNNIEVILCSVLPAEKFSWSANIEPTKIVIELNEKIKNYAVKNQITYVNYFDEMKNKSNGMKKELAEDGIHPNSKGYTVMEEILNIKLLKSLNK